MKLWILPLTALGSSVLVVVTTVALWASIGDAPWEDSEVVAPAPTEAPASFTSDEAIGITQREVAADRGFWPNNTNWVECVDADYRSSNRNWVVTCDFKVAKGGAVESAREFVFDDQTGIVR